jgi:hypothetical protein
MEARPGTARGLAVTGDCKKTDLSSDKEAQKVLFGQTAR